MTLFKALRYGTLATFVIVSVMFMPGCSDDDDTPTTPTQDATGTIVIDTEPNALDAPWTLEGPGSFEQQGSGDASFAELSIGEYTVTWGAVEGWSAPPNAVDTKNLPENATITFTGVYSPTGTMVIDVTPDAINAPWAVTGPSSYSNSGMGDATLEDLEPGTYEVCWATVEGWDAPVPACANAQVIDGETTTVSGTYTEIVVPDFVTIPAGTFEMGSPTTEPSRVSDETQHTVTLTTAFEMAVTEVTNAQYAEMAQWAVDNDHATATSLSLRDALDGSTEELLDLDSSDSAISYTGGQFVVDAGKENHPVVEVTWYGAVAYCDWLSLRQGLPRAYDHSTWTVTAASPYAAQGYRLPTEAEWEYAARAGTTTAFNNGTNCLSAGTEANYRGTSPLTGCPSGVYREATVDVGSFPANARELHDMHGNVSEWCHDGYASYSGDVTDPEGPSSGSTRLIRGGSWDFLARGCRSAFRLNAGLSYSDDGIGFRPVRSAF